MVPNMRVAVISDVHGNRWALERVLLDIGRRGINNIVNLGDCLYGPLDPAGTSRILMELDIPTVAGNEDKMIVNGLRSKTVSPTLEYVMNNLDQDAIRWISGLPGTTVVHGDLFLCHGTPERDDEYLLWRVDEEGVRKRTYDELDPLLGSVEQNIVLCGHDHVPGVVRQPGGKILVDPGSVGLQAYAEDKPWPHVMRTGSPSARYTIIESARGGWEVRDVTVDYDREAAARAAEKNDRPDWALWLRTGIA